MNCDGKPGFDSEFVGCYLKIKLRGEIDHHTATTIRNAMDHEIYKKRPRGLILDMSNVGFMDSSGLGLIMGRYAVMKELGGEVVIQNPAPAIEKILHLAGMERVVKIEKTRAEGISAKPTGRRRRSGTIVKREVSGE